MNTIDEMRDYIIFYKVSTRRGWKQETYKINSSSSEFARLRFLDMFRDSGVTSASIDEICEVEIP